MKKCFFSVWNIRTGERLHMLSGHTAAVRCVCYNGKYVVSGAYDHTIRVWLPDQERCVHTLEGHTNRVYSLVVCIEVLFYCLYQKRFF
jgi:F-box/WD-40 domain protein 7